MTVNLLSSQEPSSIFKSISVRQWQGKSLFFLRFSAAPFFFFVRLGIVPSAQNFTAITAILLFYNVFCSLAKSKYFSSFSNTFNFTLWSTGILKSTGWHFCLFLFMMTKSDFFYWDWVICFFPVPKDFVSLILSTLQWSRQSLFFLRILDLLVLFVLVQGLKL